MRYLSVFIVLTLALSVQTQMSFDLNNANYQAVSGFWQLTVPVIGGVNPLTYSYQALPATWIQSGNILNIPVAATALGGTWGIKVIVSDALGNSLRRSLLIKISGGAIYIGDYPYDQTFTFSSSGAATVSPSSSTILSSPTTTSSFSTSSSSSIVSNANTFGNPSSTAGVISLQASGTGSNTALPTSAQLDILINSGDMVSITQTVQQVIASTLSCTQKTGYLNDFLGRIQSYLTIKQAQAGNLNNIILTNQAQIEVFTNSINNYTRSIENLGIPTLQGQLASVLIRLQQAYDAFNAVNVDLTPYNLNVTANLQSVSKLSDNITKTTAQLKADNQSLSDTNALIETLKAQLIAAENNKVTLQARILLQSNQVTDAKNKVDLLNADNVRLNNQVNAINENKGLLQNNYQSLETNAQNIKNTIAAYQAQQAQYTSQITLLKNQIQQASLNLDTTSLNAVRQSISNLNSTIPSLKQQIDYVKFNCNGVVNYTVSTLNGTITYTFASSVFSTYVTSEYGQANSNAAQALLGPISKVTLTPTTIFTPSWVDLYGASFSNDIKLVSQQDTNLPTTSFFASDFQCLSTSTLTSGSGIVKQIVANYITVTMSDASSATLILGACSNVLLLNQNAPKIGNNVYWRGLQVGGSTYQVYSALLFWLFILII